MGSSRSSDVMVEILQPIFPAAQDSLCHGAIDDNVPVTVENLIIRFRKEQGYNFFSGTQGFIRMPSME